MVSQETLINSVKKSSQFRFGKLVKLLAITCRFIRFKHDYYKKPSGNFCYLTICNKESISMVRVSLYSFLKHNNKKPEKVIIISDGSWNPDDGQKYFSDFKISFVFENWNVSADYHLKKNRLSLHTWAQKQIWGKKFSAITQYAESSLVIFSDPDVLWYKNLILEEDFKKENILKISMDNSHNYDTELIKKMQAEYLFDLPPVNCGIVLIKGDLYKVSAKIHVAVNIEAETPGKFSEQTVFALLMSEFGQLWSDNEITADINDILSPLFRISNYSEKLIARHYVWKLKWLYWRDFLTK
jgi:hypothetical protein